MSHRLTSFIWCGVLAVQQTHKIMKNRLKFSHRTINTNSINHGCKVDLYRRPNTQIISHSVTSTKLGYLLTNAEHSIDKTIVLPYTTTSKVLLEKLNNL